MNPSFGRNTGHSNGPAKNSACALLRALPTQTQENNFYLDAGFSNQCLSAGLYQLHDKDKRVVAYASKTLLPPECKYSNCEKALLCTVWAIQRFSNYIGAQKVIIETCHQPVTFLNSQRIRDGVVTNARIATWLMTLQGRTSRQDMPKTTNPHLETG